MKRKHYFLAALLTIFLGLGLRRVPFIPLWIGDSLYAVMIYFGVRALFYNRPVPAAFLIALCWCFTIELFQLVQQPWLQQLRKTLPGRLILGQGFLWSDLLAYTAGLMLVFGIDSISTKRRLKN